MGFRPFVLETARSRGLKGRVKNSGRGLEVIITADEKEARSLYDYLISNAPMHSLITGHSIRKVTFKQFDSFQIEESSSEQETGALLPPDISICERCRDEISDISNHRYGYAFTTCLNCGPRYSIIRKLPYDRPHTTMADLKMCPDCKHEYDEPGGVRQHSQTNSCPECPVPMVLYNSQKQVVDRDAGIIIERCIETLKEGNILAVKGIGGYLLMADATCEESVRTLRTRKKRPSKPFAVMYPNIKSLKGDAFVDTIEESVLRGAEAPILLVHRKKDPQSGLCSEAVTPGLQTIGAFLPYSPLLELILSELNRPLIATSANLSGSPIIYSDEEAVDHLGRFADYILTFDREIVTPQDDSVVQLTGSRKQIILRRSRGLSPNYHPHPFGEIRKRVLAFGADLKGAFAIADREKLIVSQYLGDHGSYDSQLAYRHTMEHVRELYSFKPDVVLADLHPEYHSRALAEKVAQKAGAQLIPVQHHKAHFAAVLAENGLLKPDREVLGFIWDGTGYGDDGQVWGGEIFLRDEGGLSRRMHLEYFPVLSGDKMSLEPRLSALSLFADMPGAEPILRSMFSEKEWRYYQKLFAAPARIRTSSMGRFIDAIAAILGICSFNSYEAEAAIKLENVARKGGRDDAREFREKTDVNNCIQGFKAGRMTSQSDSYRDAGEYGKGAVNESIQQNRKFGDCISGFGPGDDQQSRKVADNLQVPESGDYTFELCDDVIRWRPVLMGVLLDIEEKKSTEMIVNKLFRSIGKLVFQVSRQTDVQDLAFSGGVFQNVVLLNTLLDLKPDDTRLWFHKKLSPNDENIPFGQVAYYDKFLK